MKYTCVPRDRMKKKGGGKNRILLPHKVRRYRDLQRPDRERYETAHDACVPRRRKVLSCVRRAIDTTCYFGSAIPRRAAPLTGISGLPSLVGFATFILRLLQCRGE